MNEHPLTVTCHRTPEALTRLADAWDRLLDKALVKTPFATHEWQAAWWKHFGRHQSLYLLSVERQGELVAIAPFMLGRRGPFRLLQFIGTGRSDYLDFIIAAHCREALPAIIAYLARHADEWDLISLEDWAEDSAHLARWRDLLPETGWQCSIRPSTVCPKLSCENGWGAYLQSKSSKHRKNLRRLERHVEHSPHLRIRSGRDWEVAAQLSSIVRIESRSWKMAQGNPRITGPTATLFFSELFEAFRRRNWLETWYLLHDDEPVAYTINYLYDGKLYFYNVAYDLRHADQSPGTALTMHVLRNAFERRIVEYDFLRGDEPYKRLWTHEARQLYHAVIIGRGLRARLAYALLIAPRWLVRRSAWLRRLAARVKPFVTRRVPA
ncbi:MAG: GNAT family N-acetyltransferase [Nitrospirota bacterium]